MSLSDSDSDCEFVKTSSVKGHKSAPNDEKFRIKIKARNKKTIGLLYTLVKGQVLPYTPELEGHQIAFGQDLKPDMGPGWTTEENKGCWIFRGQNSFLPHSALWERPVG